MHTPVVNELRRRLEPVTHDAFADPPMTGAGPVARDVGDVARRSAPSPRTTVGRT